MIVSAHQASIATTSKWKREWWAVGHVRADLGQTTSHTNAIRVIIRIRRGLEEFVTVFGYLLGHYLRFLTRTLHECVDHRIEDLLWSGLLFWLFLRLLQRCVFQAHEVNSNKLGLFTSHHYGMVHHVIQNGGHVNHRWRRHGIHHELHEGITRSTQTQYWLTHQELILWGRTEVCNVNGANMFNCLHSITHSRTHGRLVVTWVSSRRSKEHR